MIWYLEVNFAFAKYIAEIVALWDTSKGRLPWHAIHLNFLKYTLIY